MPGYTGYPKGREFRKVLNVGVGDENPVLSIKAPILCGYFVIGDASWVEGSEGFGGLPCRANPKP